MLVKHLQYMFKKITDFSFNVLLTLDDDVFLCSKDAIGCCSLLQGCTSNLSLCFLHTQIVRISVSLINTTQGRGIHRNSPLCG